MQLNYFSKKWTKGKNCHKNYFVQHRIDDLGNIWFWAQA